MQIQAPRKPFPKYKWRWASTMPTESLNEPPVFFGVLRAMRHAEGKYPSSSDFEAALRNIQSKSGIPKLDLLRTGKRNLIRNSGQYWKALGLLGDTRRGIVLTELGNKVADGNITKQEFAAITIKTLELPNKKIEPDDSSWAAAHLVIHPLELILAILLKLYAKAGAGEAYLTPEELKLIVIPLAGDNRNPNEHADAIIQFRKGSLQIDSWPNCVPAANDGRMAREFLIFLNRYDFCDLIESKKNGNEKYILNPQNVSAISELLSMPLPIEPQQLENATRNAISIDLKSRSRKTASILERPTQAKFRREILEAYRRTCFLSGETMLDVLVAAHIVPVENGGPDSTANGILLRADLHILYDAGHIRISSDGKIHLSDALKANSTYAKNLPSQITWPKFVSKDALAWREKFY